MKCILCWRSFARGKYWNG